MKTYDYFNSTSDPQSDPLAGVTNNNNTYCAMSLEPETGKDEETNGIQTIGLALITIGLVLIIICVVSIEKRCSYTVIRPGAELQRISVVSSEKRCSYTVIRHNYNV